MAIDTTLQIEDSDADVPDAGSVSVWIDAAAAVAGVESGEVTVRFVDVAEMTELNRQFRDQDKATNVLSFEFEDPPGMSEASGILGDIVVCSDVVRREARDFEIDSNARFAHMIVHGLLHLVGYDHLEPADASKMERAESSALTGIGLEDPWRDDVKVTV